MTRLEAIQPPAMTVRSADEHQYLHQGSVDYGAFRRRIARKLANGTTRLFFYGTKESS